MYSFIWELPIRSGKGWQQQLLSCLGLLGQLKELALTFERLGFGVLLLTSVGEEPGHYLTPGISGVKVILDDLKDQSLHSQGREKAGSASLLPGFPTRGQQIVSDSALQCVRALIRLWSSAHGSRDAI